MALPLDKSVPNLIKRIAKERHQVTTLFIFLASLVVGIPLFQVSQQVLASNPGIGVTVTATAESSGQIPVKQGSSIVLDIVVCVGYRVTFTAQGVPGGGTYQWEADNLFNGNTAYNAETGVITLTALAESMRARVALEIAEACINDVLIRDLANQVDVPVRTSRVPRLDFEGN